MNNNLITQDDVAFLHECNMYPTYYLGKLTAVTIITENDEGSLINDEELLRLADILVRYVKYGIEIPTPLD